MIRTPLVQELLERVRTLEERADVQGVMLNEVRIQAITTVNNLERKLQGTLAELKVAREEAKGEGGA